MIYKFLLQILLSVDKNAFWEFSFLLYSYGSTLVNKSFVMMTIKDSTYDSHILIRIVRGPNKPLVHHQHHNSIWLYFL